MKIRVGQKFGKWNTIRYVGGDRQRWLCRCSCRREKPVRQDSLLAGTSTNCGCEGGRHKIITPENSLSATHPFLVSEWHPANTLKPTEVTFGLHTRILWRCKRGHEWTATISHRVHGRGCPQCYRIDHPENQRIVRTRGKPTVDITHPHLLEEWHPSNTLKPSEVTYASRRNILWVCGEGHTWTTSVNSRTLSNSGCPECSLAHRSDAVRVSRSKGKPTLDITHPHLLQEWHASNILRPTDVTTGSRMVIMWICSEGHIWNTRVVTRTRGHGCKRCINTSGRTTSEFVRLSRLIHHNRYSYSQTMYVTSQAKVNIGCPDHGYFWQTPDGHLKGWGCFKCGLTKRQARRRGEVVSPLTPQQQRRFDHLVETLSKNVQLVAR